MHTKKRLNMLAAYTGHKGPRTVAAVMDGIPDELMARLSGRELGLVMNAVNNAYHRGRASTGAEVIDANAVFVNHLDRVIDIPNA